MHLLQKILFNFFIFTDEILYFIRSYHPAKTKWEIIKTYIKVNIKFYTVCRFLKINNEYVLGMKVSFFDYRAFNFLFHEIFFKSIYYLKVTKKHPIIFDCGANIGMATLYFKFLYPDSIIYAFEPDPHAFELLKKNIEQNHFENIHLYNIALLNRKGKINFYVNNAMLGETRMSILKHKFMKNSIKVEADVLSDYIGNKQVDFLKMDIEGTEINVLNELSRTRTMRQINELIIEYHHNIIDSKATFSLLLKLLENNGYNYRIDTGSLLVYQKNIFQDILVYAYKQTYKTI